MATGKLPVVRLLPKVLVCFPSTTLLISFLLMFFMQKNTLNQQYIIKMNKIIKKTQQTCNFLNKETCKKMGTALILRNGLHLFQIIFTFVLR